MPLTPEDVANKQFTSTRLSRATTRPRSMSSSTRSRPSSTRLYRENDELRSKLSAAQRQLAEGGGRGQHARADRAVRCRLQQPAPPPPPPPPPAPARPVAQAPSGGNVSETATGILALAQRTADEHVSEARTQADRIIGEARTRADQLKREADDKHRQMIGSLENERVTLEREVEKLRTFEREYRSRLKSYLESQLRELDGRGPSRAGRRAPGSAASRRGQPPARAASPVSRAPSAARSPRVPRWAATRRAVRRPSRRASAATARTAAESPGERRPAPADGATPAGPRGGRRRRRAGPEEGQVPVAASRRKGSRAGGAGSVTRLPSAASPPRARTLVRTVRVTPRRPRRPGSPSPGRS